MRNSRYNQKRGTPGVRVVCAIVFCIFTFVFLYCYQSDMLAIAQHVLGKGMTKYNAMIGALVITFILQLLQILLCPVIGLYGKYHALTFFPSFICLTLLTDVALDNHGVMWHDYWVWLIPVLLIVWGGAVLLFKQVESLDATYNNRLFHFSALWHNLLILTIGFLFVGLLSNGNDIMHYRARAEMALLHGDIEKSLNIGRHSLHSDATLTMQRAYALALRGEMGERLFCYPIEGNSADMLPTDSSSSTQFVIYPTDSLYALLGAKPAKTMSAYCYVKALHKQGLATQVAHDYWLCMLLVDCKLEEFVNILPQFYSINDSLPRHYAEAICVYAVQTNDTAVLSGLRQSIISDMKTHIHSDTKQSVVYDMKDTVVDKKTPTPYGMKAREDGNLYQLYYDARMNALH